MELTKLKNENEEDKSDNIYARDIYEKWGK